MPPSLTPLSPCHIHVPLWSTLQRGTRVLPMPGMHVRDPQFPWGYNNHLGAQPRPHNPSSPTILTPPSFHFLVTVDMSSFSSSSSTHFIDILELGHIVLDNRMTDLINQLFQTDEGSSAYLHYYHHITWNIQRLEQELDQLHQEQQSIHEHLMSSPCFQCILRPIIQTHCIRSNWSGFHPYNSRPLNWQNPTDSPPSSIPSQSSSNNKLPTEAATPPPKDAQPGSANLPIDVNAFQDQFDFVTPTKPYSRPDNLQPRFKPTCECCGQWRHEEPTCDTPICSFHKCYICAWRRRWQSSFCDHYDVSPAPLQTSLDSVVTPSPMTTIPNEEPTVIHRIKSGILER